MSMTYCNADQALTAVVRGPESPQHETDTQYSQQDAPRIHVDRLAKFQCPKKIPKCGINKAFLILSYLILSSASQPGWKPHCSSWIQGSSDIISTLVYTTGWGMWFPWRWNTPSDPLKKETMSLVCSSEAMLQTSVSQRCVNLDNPTTSRALRDLSAHINFLNKTEPIIAY